MFRLLKQKRVEENHTIAKEEFAKNGYNKNAIIYRIKGAGSTC